MAHNRQSRPGCGLGCQVKALETFEDVPSLLGSSQMRRAFVEDRRDAMRYQTETVQPREGARFRVRGVKFAVYDFVFRV